MAEEATRLRDVILRINDVVENVSGDAWEEAMQDIRALINEARGIESDSLSPAAQLSRFHERNG